MFQDHKAKMEDLERIVDRKLCEDEAVVSMDDEHASISHELTEEGMEENEEDSDGNDEDAFAEYDEYVEKAIEDSIMGAADTPAPGASSLAGFGRSSKGEQEFSN